MNKFSGNGDSFSDEYDLHDPEQRKAGIIVLLAMFVPLLGLCGYGAYQIGTDGNLFVAIVSILFGVFTAMIGVTTAVIYNKRHSSYGCDEEEIRRIRVIRSIMIIIFACATYIPFLPFIVSLVFAHKYPEASFYTKGMNAQLFTFIWSLMCLLVFGVVGLFIYLGVIPMPF